MAAVIGILFVASPSSGAGDQRSAYASPTEQQRAPAVSTPHLEAPELNLQQDSGNRQDVLEKALLTVGVAAAVGVIALIGYAIRKKVGFWLHRPQTEEDGAAEEHH